MLDEIAGLAGEVLDGADSPEQAWKALGQAGLLSIATPVALGGDGLGMAEVAALLGEIGRRGVAVPALATLALGVLPAARWGTAEQQEALLAPGAILTGAARCDAATDGHTLTGTAVGVPYAEQAGRILVPVRTGVAVVDPRDTALTRTPTAGATPEYSVSFVDTPVETVLAGARLEPYATAGACALGAGALAGALDLTAEHVRTREQFGRPLATFQAVAQQIADVYVAARTVRLATREACRSLDDADLAVAAYWFATEAPAAVRTCHHLHGGLGLDVTYPLHRHSSLIRDLVRALGGAEHRLEGVAAC